jgi:hypothetical protein
VTDTPLPDPSARQLCDAMLQAVEPLFDVRLAAMLVPMRHSALRTLLSRHKAEFPARYRLDGSGHRRVRVLYASEVRRIRAMVIRGPL